MKAAFLIGRIAFGGYFLYNGINHIKNRNMLSQYAGAKNIPAPKAAVIVSGVAMLIGGSSILLGIKPKYGALVIVGFLASVSPTIHNFWRDEDANQREGNIINFAKNMALLGAALSLMGVEEPWPASVPLAQPSTIDRLRSATKHRVAA